MKLKKAWSLDDKRTNRYDLNTYMIPTDDNKLTWGWSQDISGPIERARVIRENYLSNKKFAADIKVEASIPSIILEQICRENGFRFPPNPDQLEYILKLIDRNPDYKKFRTGR